jgi:hypothetical protein
MGQAWANYEKKWQEDRDRQLKEITESRERQIAENNRLRELDDEARKKLWEKVTP